MIIGVWNRSSFRMRQYRWYWMANVLVHITYLLQAVALAWHMLDVTDSAFQVGLVAFAYGLPLLVVSPFSGLLADRRKRQWVVLSALAVAVMTSGLLALLVNGGSSTSLHILIASCVLGTSFAFYGPARMALLPNLVPDAMVFNATTVSYAGTRLMGFFGPVLAGYLLELTDISVTLSVQTILFAIGAFLYFKATHDMPSPKRKNQPNVNILKGFADIINYLRKDRAVFALLLLSLVFVPFGMPYQKLMPIFVAEVLAEGPALLGLLVGCASLGSAVSGFGVAAIGEVYPKGLAILLFSIAFGIGLVVFSFISDPAVALILIFLIGIFSGVFLTNINVLLLTQIPDDLRGRMMSLWSMVWGLIPVSTLIAGSVAEYWGVAIVLSVAGTCVTITCAVMLASRSPLLDL